MQEQTIILVSSALGDTLAWVPVVEEYQKQKQCKIKLITWYNELFDQYPNIEFIEQTQLYQKWFSTHTEPPVLKEDLGINYLIGLNDPTDPLTKPLQQVAADILGIDFTETRPRLNFEPKEPKVEGKYICIAPHASSEQKHWDYEGWQQVIDYYNIKGYKVVYISYEEPTDLKHIIDQSGQPITETMNNIYHSEAVIGLSSGVSWLAWGLEAKVVLVSTHTPIEFKCERVYDEQISPNMVIEATNRVVGDSIDDV